VSTDVLFSVDVECDGPVPGPYSMISIGACVAGTFDGHRYHPRDPEAATFYAELAPISESWVPEALAVSGLDRDELVRAGEHPRGAMQRFFTWVMREGANGTPVFCAYPLGFDWMFAYWYMERFATSPFGHSRALDIKTLYAAKADVPIAESFKGKMPRELRSRREHTHNALDDAMEQADLLSNIMLWDPYGPVGSPSGPRDPRSRREGRR
jgi:hypothetical protein